MGGLFQEGLRKHIYFLGENLLPRSYNMLSSMLIKMFDILSVAK